MDSKTEQYVKRVLQEARRAAPEPSPYLKTRILAEYRSRRQEQRIRWWKFLTLGSAAASAMVVAGLFLITQPKGAYVAQVDEKVLIRVEVEKLQGTGVKFAEVDLPDGVHFYSEKYPELKDLRSVTLAWNENMDMSRLPVVIQASEAGAKKIRIRFLNNDHALLKEQQVMIKFAKGAV